MNPRAAFFIDGFNLYHSLAAYAKESGDHSLKWLDLIGLAKGSLHEVGGSSELRSLHYFTALPEHLYLADPGRLQRHRTYLRALTAHGSLRPYIILGRIAQQQVQVRIASGEITGSIWREKGTDVALAMALLREASKGDMDEAVIVSGDADYLPAVKLFREMYPDIGLRFAFPRGRASKELLREAPNSFTLTSAAYLSHRLPERIRLPSGKFLHCPAEWRRKPSMS
ncbi:MAG: NYN domain-containing protein [Verrucomicrobia bacterium]|nr:NYN domain-containing protein [Verrucomicrobiota bacterium]NBS04936.1 NYN domain-containing protein [Verrucomicrobiota bacterium]NBY35861.1 NYN domain-containing protein [Verrucomicrobiota bacterium]